MVSMTQSTEKIHEVVEIIKNYGDLAAEPITRLHALAPECRVEIVELVDEINNSISLKREVDRLESRIIQLRHQATIGGNGTRTERIIATLVDELTPLAIAHSSARLGARDTTILGDHLEAVRCDFDDAGLMDLFDTIIRYGILRTRRQRSIGRIHTTLETIKTVARR